MVIPRPVSDIEGVIPNQPSRKQVSFDTGFLEGILKILEEIGGVVPVEV